MNSGARMPRKVPCSRGTRERERHGMWHVRDEPVSENTMGCGTFGMNP